jgi:hypothetical protein
MLKNTVSGVEPDPKVDIEIEKFVDTNYTKKIRLNHCLRQYNNVKAIIDE